MIFLILFMWWCVLPSELALPVSVTIAWLYWRTIRTR